MARQATGSGALGRAGCEAAPPPAIGNWLHGQFCGDDGYFPRGSSVLRQVHEERLVGLFFGQRALAIGALHPVNYTGTSQSTGGRERPFRRLVRTANDFETIFFGTRAEADKRARRRCTGCTGACNGELPEDAGPFAGGHAATTRSTPS